MKQHLQIEDNPHSSNSGCFSWDNFRLDGRRILARLDRLYVFKNSSSTSSRKLLSYSIRGDCGWSDDRPVELEVQLAVGSQRACCWKMSSYYLLEAKSEIEKVWRAQAATSLFFRKVKAVIHFYKKFCKQKAQDSRELESSLRRQLEHVTRALDDVSDCPILQQ
jgi:hypothetical protein